MSGFLNDVTAILLMVPLSIQIAVAIGLHPFAIVIPEVLASNIGGAASAPIVASAFHPTLAPVGVLLAVAGYVLGTYAGLLCMALLKAVAGA